jgi:hypothetical protein
MARFIGLGKKTIEVLYLFPVQARKNAALLRNYL